MNFRRNHEGYYDPTAGEALEHIAHEERRKRSLAKKQNQQVPEEWQEPSPQTRKQLRREAEK